MRSWRCAGHCCTMFSRFGVEQGIQEDGTPKIRPVDDFSASGTCALLVSALYARSRVWHTQV